MNVVVTTPTGNVGRNVVAQLIRAGIRPTVLLRDKSRLDSDLLSSVNPVECNLLDEQAVVNVCRDADALFWVSPSTGQEDPIEGHEALGRNAAKAIRANIIDRVVFQSSGGAEKREGAGEIDGLGRVERILEALDCNTMVLRCGYFFTNLIMSIDDLRAGVLQTTLPLDQPMPWVDPRDIAEVATGYLLRSDWTGHQRQAVHGPADLTFTMAAEVVSKATGNTVEAQRISDDDLRSALASFGMNEKQVDAIAKMSSGLIDFEFEDKRSLRSTTPTSLGSWAYSTLRPMLVE